MERHWFWTNGEDRNQLYREITYDAQSFASRKFVSAALHQSHVLLGV